MAQVKVFYEPEMELLTVFWQAPRKQQLCTALGDGVVLIKDERSGGAERDGDSVLPSGGCAVRRRVGRDRTASRDGGRSLIDGWRRHDPTQDTDGGGLLIPQFPARQPARTCYTPL